jgi:methylated-DNA-[protein]-cysteine S-methyltransferase
MNRQPSECLLLERALVAAATGDADPEARARVAAHVRACAPCRNEYEGYRALERAVTDWRQATPPTDEARARERLEARLADLRRRTLLYRIFPSPLGQLLIARSEQGVVLVEYLWRGHDLSASRLLPSADVEALEDGAEVEAIYRDLLEYLGGRRPLLDWPVDLRLARSDFHRAVLRATATIPHGAVTSYAGLARDVGNPKATRAVAQALRWNPVPIIVPCHRVVGASGRLTGYAGDRVTLKERLLAVEGVRTVHARRDRWVARAGMYVRTPDGQQYCRPTCGWLTPAALGQLTLFASTQSAQAAGLTPCEECRPDLDPVSR